MSWDISVVDMPEQYRSVNDIPAEFRGKSCARATFIAEIVKAFPAADFSDPSWGRIDGADWSIEVNIGQNEETDGFMLHVRGADDAVAAVLTLLRAIKLRGIDLQTGEFLSLEPAASASFGAWRGYRD